MWEEGNVPLLVLVAIAHFTSLHTPSVRFAWTQDRVNEVAAASLEAALTLRLLSVRPQSAESEAEHVERMRGYLRATNLTLRVAQAILRSGTPSAGGNTARQCWSQLREAAGHLRTEAEEARRSLRKVIANPRADEALFLQCGDALKRLSTANQTVLNLLREVEP